MDLVLTLRNFGGGATNVAASLETSDPYVTVHSGSADFGNLPAGGTASNEDNPFVIQSSSGTRRGHTAHFTLTTTYPTGQTVSEFRLSVGKREYLVWDPSPDVTGGPIMASLLTALGFSGGFSPDLSWIDATRYHTIFVSVGIYPSNYRIASGSPQANALLGHLAAGGGLYLEGGDVWYYDPGMGGHDFRPVFGITSYDDGGSDLYQIVGQPGTFAQGMTFAYGGENEWIDRLGAYGGAQVLFMNNAPVYGCAVSNDPGGHRTIGASFEFAGLIDGLPPSDRRTLIQAYMDFFLPLDPQDLAVTEGAACTLSPSRPNPLRTTSFVELMLPREAVVRIDLIDASGRLVQPLASARHAAGRHVLPIDGRRLTAGIYFLRAQVDGETLTRRCVVAR